MKYLSFVLIFLLSSSLSFAQSEEVDKFLGNEFKQEINVSYGLLSSNFMLIDYAHDLSGFLTGIGTLFTNKIRYDYTTRTGVFHAGYKRALRPKWRVGAAFTLERVASNMIDDRENVLLATEKVNAFAIAAETDYSYVLKEKMRMYSGFGMAFASNKYNRDAKRDDFEVSDERVFFPNIHVTGFGIRFGGKVAGFAELGFGYKGILNAGVSIGL